MTRRLSNPTLPVLIAGALVLAAGQGAGLAETAPASSPTLPLAAPLASTLALPPERPVAADVPNARATLSIAARFEAEQALLTRLRVSPSGEDAYRLSDLLAGGVMAGADNPLRKADVAGAAAILRTRMKNGDLSTGTVLRYGRLLVRLADREALQGLEPLLRAAMFAGSADAAHVLARGAELGLIGTPREAAQLRDAAAAMGNVNAIAEIALRGTVGAIAKAEALRTLEAAAAQSSEAALTLGRAYAAGTLSEPDRDSAERWLRLAAAGGEPKAMLELARLLIADEGRARPHEIVTLLSGAADAGSVDAAMALGRDAAADGPLDVPTEIGRSWLTRARAVGHEGAAVDLAVLDLRDALTADLEPAETVAAIERALAPIASDPAALATLAGGTWRGLALEQAEPVLLPLLDTATRRGSTTAGLAYDAYLEAKGQRMAEPAARALLDGLRHDASRSSATAQFSLARLILDGRLPQDTDEEAEALDLLFASADRDNGQAMLRIARMYAYGERLAASAIFARKWYERAARRQVAAAPWELAELLSRSADPADQAEAETFYLGRLAEADPRASVALARHYARRDRLDEARLVQLLPAASPDDFVEIAGLVAARGTADDLALAKRMLAPIAEAPDRPEARAAYAALLLSPEATAEERERGLALLTQSAERGENAAKVELASFYLGAKAYEAEAAKAVALLEEVIADDPRNGRARFALALAYLGGQGVARSPETAAAIIDAIGTDGLASVPTALLEADRLTYAELGRDPQEAVRLLQAQAARGSFAAERALGLIYLSGFSTHQDPDMAADLLSRSAAGGDREAMAAFGHLQLNGIGVARSTNAGLDGLTTAAARGHTAAMYDLSRIYALGVAGEVDAEQSTAWLHEAALRNHPSAAFQLGLSYLAGDGVSPDRDEAMRWLRTAGTNGNLLAQRTYDALLRTDVSSSTSAELPITAE